MTQTEKADRYDYLVREGDVLNRKLSRLQSQNAGFNTKSEAYDKEVANLRGGLLRLEQDMNKLFE